MEEKYYEYIRKNYKKDGFIYCIDNGMKIKGMKVVKCGRIRMKRDEDEWMVVEKLLKRYNTYYINCELLQWKRVGNNIDAERKLFSILSSLHYEKEKYIYEKNTIDKAFKQVEDEFPTIESIITKMSIQKQTQLNEHIRQVEKHN